MNVEMNERRRSGGLGGRRGEPRRGAVGRLALVAGRAEPGASGCCCAPDRRRRWRSRCCAACWWLAGHKPDDGLFWVYVLVPIAVAFVAEQLRLASAQTVLDGRGLEDARAVGGLPAADQRSVVLQIVRREMGVMTLSAGAMAFLLVRAATTAAGF